MKKFISKILALSLSLGLCGCGGTQTASTEAKPTETIPGPSAPAAFSVGYAKANITPTESVPMGGYGNSDTRWSTNVVDYLELICVAFTDEAGETVLFFAADLLMAYDHVTEALRTAVSQATGVPQDHIFYHVVHNHSGPETQKTGEPSITSYIQLHTDAAVRIAGEAMADRKAAQMYTGFTRLENVNFVRHYLLSDGTYKGEGVGSVAKDRIIGHTAAPDDLLQVVKFVREGGKDVVLVNWQGHPIGHAGSNDTALTSTSAGALRRELESSADCLPVYILGGSGNMNNQSQLKTEEKYSSMQDFGKGVAQEVMAVMDNSTPSSTGNIRLRESVLSIENNKGENRAVPLYAFSIGELAFVTAPAEIFSDNAVAVRDASKFPMTLYASCTNGYNGYLPTPKPFDYYAYEVRITKFPMGTAELLQQEQTKMLDAIFAESGLTETEKTPGYLTEEFRPVTNGVTYTPISTEAVAVENGFYAFQLFDGTAVKNMLAISKEVAEQVLAKESTMLLFDAQNVIVGIA